MKYTPNIKLSTIPTSIWFDVDLNKDNILKIRNKNEIKIITSSLTSNQSFPIERPVGGVADREILIGVWGYQHRCYLVFVHSAKSSEQAGLSKRIPCRLTKREGVPMFVCLRIWILWSVRNLFDCKRRRAFMLTSKLVATVCYSHSSCLSLYILRKGSSCFFWISSLKQDSF